MKILFISTVSSEERIVRLHAATGRNPGFAIQKFNRLVAEGMALNGADVECISAPPVDTDMRGMVRWGRERVNDVDYRYVQVANWPVLRQASQFLGTFRRVLTARGKRSDVRVVCDMVNTGVGLAALIAAKIRGFQTGGILTDMPGLMKCDVGLKSRIATKVNHAFMDRFDKYVFLSVPMREVNTRHRPDIIMEGLVRINADAEPATAAAAAASKPADAAAKPTNATAKQTDAAASKSIVYVGALYVKYGVRTLCEAMQYVDDKDVTLDFYGSGEMVDEIRRLGESDPRIRYHGVLSDAEIFEAEQNAALLANPRPTHEAFAKYSFPSKVMEYMLSGTPVLTTPLPDDYLEHVYIIDDETPQGMARAINAIMALPAEQRAAKGQAGRRFVMQHKNYRLQAARILELLRK